MWNKILRVKDKLLSKAGYGRSGFLLRKGEYASAE